MKTARPSPGESRAAVLADAVCAQGAALPLQLRMLGPYG